MKALVTSTIAALALLISVNTAFAGDPRCELIFRETPLLQVNKFAQLAAPVPWSLARLKTAVSNAYDKARYLASRKWQGISDRGFISGEFDGEAVDALVAKDRLVYWYIRIFVVPSIKDPLMQGVYLINKGENAEQTSTLIYEAAGQVFNRMLKNDSMYFFKVKEDGATEVVPPELIAENLNPEKMFWDLNDPEHGPYIRQNGYALPRYRGVIRYEDTIGSGRYKDAKKLTRQLVDERGFRVRFNVDFEAALNMVRDQKRLVEGQWVSNSLYKNDDGTPNANYRDTLAAFKAGRAFSVEVWNKEGELVGGIIGKIDGTLYSPESTFYDQARYPDIGIRFSEIGVMAMMERLHEAGIDFADAGMVSTFTALMRGLLVPAIVFEKMAGTLPSTANVDFSRDVYPPKIIQEKGVKAVQLAPRKERFAKPAQP